MNDVVATGCVWPGCSHPAEYDLWGQMFRVRGPNCYAHAARQVGCLCSKCVAQYAIKELARGNA